MVRARAPVASTMFLAVTSVVLPSFVTVSLPLPASLASPGITVILCFFIRKLTPSDNCLETARLRLTTFSMSNLKLSADMPNSSSRCSMCQVSDERSSALVGMQPQFRQMPPMRSRSTTAVFRPSWAQRMAQT